MCLDCLRSEMIGGRDCDKVIDDLVQHDKVTVDASLISVIAVYGDKEEHSPKQRMGIDNYILAW